MATGATATQAGLLMIPLMGTLLVASVVSGNVVSKTGRYRVLPIAGAVVLAIGLVLLAAVRVDTPVVVICLYLAVMGIGLGMNMQILTLIVQNSFPHKMVGTTTASNNFFRQVGTSVGSAVVGSVFAGRLAELLAEKLPAGTGSESGTSSLTPSLVSSLPDAIRLPIIESYNGALIPIFAFVVPLAVIAAIALCFIKVKSLATEIEHEIPAESLAEGQLTITEFDAVEPAEVANRPAARR